MFTTFLNPTVWLLVATAAVAIRGAVGGETARGSLDALWRQAGKWPILVLLASVAGAGIASRVVIGYVAPGAYAEEVAAARSFISDRQLYGGDSRSQLTQWITETSGPQPPWAGLPGVTACHASAMANRGRFFTNHAHTPMLLLAGVPVVAVGGGRALYICLLLLSVAAIACMAAMAMKRMEISWRSRGALLVVTALAGWQPILAGIRQGDAVLPAAGLAAIAWYYARHNRRWIGAAAAAMASCVAVPAVGALVALVRAAPRTAALSIAVYAGIVAATVALAGTAIVPGFFETAVETARTYTPAPTNYAVLSRIAAVSAVTPLVFVVVAIAFLCTWWRTRRVDDAFAAFVSLGVMIAPVLWSQHLALLFIPALVLLLRIREKGSSTALAVWAVLVLPLSLPDSAAALLGDLFSVGPWGPAVPVVPIALVALWAWVVFGSERLGFVAPVTVPGAAGVLR